MCGSRHQAASPHLHSTRKCSYFGDGASRKVSRLGLNSSGSSITRAWPLFSNTSRGGLLGRCFAVN